MEFTIAELARAVNKSETYVRQHVNRKHLAVRKGRGAGCWCPSARRPVGPGLVGYPLLHRYMRHWRQGSWNDGQRG